MTPPQRLTPRAVWSRRGVETGDHRPLVHDPASVLVSIAERKPLEETNCADHHHH